MTQEQIDLLTELGINLTAATLAAIVAELYTLYGDDGSVPSDNMSEAINIMRMEGEAKKGYHDFTRMTRQAETALTAG